MFSWCPVLFLLLCCYCQVLDILSELGEDHPSHGKSNLDRWSVMSFPFVSIATFSSRVSIGGSKGVQTDQSREESRQEELWGWETSVCPLLAPIVRPLLPNQWSDAHQHTSIQPTWLVGSTPRASQCKLTVCGPRMFCQLKPQTNKQIFCNARQFTPCWTETPHRSACFAETRVQTATNNKSVAFFWGRSSTWVYVSNTFSCHETELLCMFVRERFMTFMIFPGVRRCGQITSRWRASGPSSRPPSPWCLARPAWLHWVLSAACLSTFCRKLEFMCRELSPPLVMDNVWNDWMSRTNWNVPFSISCSIFR